MLFRSIGTGAAVVAVTGAATLDRAGPGVWTGLIVLIGLTLGCLAVVSTPGLLGWMVRLVARQGGGEGGAGDLPTPRPGALLVGLTANGAAWLLYGVALYWLAAGVFGGPGLGVSEAIAAFTASYLAGFLFLLAPGGLGVREGVFVLMTQATIGPAHALALAAVSRVGMTVADLMAAAPFLIHRGDRGVTT